MYTGNVKLITCVTSVGTNFRPNSIYGTTASWLAREMHFSPKVQVLRSERLIQSAMNQQVEVLRSLCCVSKTAICTVVPTSKLVSPASPFTGKGPAGETTSKSVPPAGHDRVMVQIAVFDTQRRDRRASTC